MLSTISARNPTPHPMSSVNVTVTSFSSNPPVYSQRKKTAPKDFVSGLKSMRIQPEIFGTFQDPELVLGGLQETAEIQGLDAIAV